MLSEGPKDEFTSRYADPNHPSNSGSIISLATGGYVNPPPLGSQRRDHMQGGGGFLGGVLSGGGSQDAHQNTQAGRGGLLGSSLGRCADFEKRRGFGSRDRGALLGRGGLFGRGSGGTRGPGLLGGILGGRKDSTPTITPAASSQNSAPQEQGRPNPDRGASGRLGLGGSSGNNGLIGGGFTAVKKILGRVSLLFPASQ